MAVLLKVKNSQAFVKELNKVLSQNSIRGKSDEGWIIENFLWVNRFVYGRGWQVAYLHEPA